MKQTVLGYWLENREIMVRILAGQEFLLSLSRVQTDCGAHPAASKADTGSSSIGSIAVGFCSKTRYLHRVPGLRMSGAMPARPIRFKSLCYI